MIAIIEKGLQTTVQDYPGRVGYWNIGIPPSGPMDPLALRIANKLVGNQESAAGLEITARGPRILFLEDSKIALTGAELHGSLDGKEIPWWKGIMAKKGSILSLKSLKGHGLRSYLAISGGIDVPVYLGSKSTFPGHFGGLDGRALVAGDLLSVDREERERAFAQEPKEVPDQLVPQYTDEWLVGAMLGPHEAPDFFTFEDVKVFFNHDWQVHHNSNRLGYRLKGPRPNFAREDGGEGGSHPSNIHDCAYAIGTINLTGDTPIILTVDGPSLGGFVSIATIVSSEIWKIGQAAPNNTIRFQKMSYKEAFSRRWMQEKALRSI